MNTRRLEIAGFCGLILFLIFLNFYPRNQGKALRQANAQNQYYEIVNRQQDSLLNEVLTFLNQFEENLDSLRATEILIYDLNQNFEHEASFQERMYAGLDQIKGRLVSNRNIIDSLESRATQLGSENTHLKKTISRLSQRLSQKALAMAELEQSLAQAHGRIKSLGKKVKHLEKSRTQIVHQTQRLKDTLSRHRTTISVQGKYIQQQEAKLKKGYLISGNLKELKKSGVIKKAGGVAGIGSIPKLSDEINQDEFVPVDIHHLTMIPFSGQRIELVSPHPPSSYKIIGPKAGNPVSRLEILTPEDFWSASRYLVVLTK